VRTPAETAVATVSSTFADSAVLRRRRRLPAGFTLRDALRFAVGAGVSPALFLYSQKAPLPAAVHGAATAMRTVTLPAVNLPILLVSAVCDTFNGFHLCVIPALRVCLTLCVGFVHRSPSMVHLVMWLTRTSSAAGEFTRHLCCQS
jgi:hypothetical protein